MSIFAPTSAQPELNLNAASYNNGIIDLANDDDDEEEKRERSSLSRSPPALKINLRSATPPPPSTTQKSTSSTTNINGNESLDRRSSKSDATKVRTTSKTTHKTRDSSRRRSSSKTRSSKRNTSSTVAPASKSLKNRSRSRTPPPTAMRSKSRSRSRSRSERIRMRSRSRSLRNNRSRSRSKQRQRSRTRSRSLSRYLMPHHHRYTNGGSNRRVSRTPPPFSRHSNNYPTSYGYRGHQRPPYLSSSAHNGHSRHFNGPYRSPDSFYDRFNAPQNNVLAVFGLDKRANEQDLFDVYRKYGCKECKIIMDKHVRKKKCLRSLNKTFSIS